MTLAGLWLMLQVFVWLVQCIFLCYLTPCCRKWPKLACDLCYKCLPDLYNAFFCVTSTRVVGNDPSWLAGHIRSRPHSHLFHRQPLHWVVFPKVFSKIPVFLKIYVSLQMHLCGISIDAECDSFLFVCFCDCLVLLPTSELARRWWRQRVSFGKLQPRRVLREFHTSHSWAG